MVGSSGGMKDVSRVSDGGFSIGMIDFDGGLMEDVQLARDSKIIGTRQEKWWN